MGESEFKGVDFDSYRALRAWCLEMVFSKLAISSSARGVDEYIRLLDYVYGFVSGERRADLPASSPASDVKTSLAHNLLAAREELNGKKEN